MSSPQGVTLSYWDSCTVNSFVFPISLRLPASCALYPYVTVTTTTDFGNQIHNPDKWKAPDKYQMKLTIPWWLIFKLTNHLNIYISLSISALKCILGIMNVIRKDAVSSVLSKMSALTEPQWLACHCPHWKGREPLTYCFLSHVVVSFQLWWVCRTFVSSAVWRDWFS